MGTDEVTLIFKVKAHWLPIPTRVVAGPQVALLGPLPPSLFSGSSGEVSWDHHPGSLPVLQ